MRYFVAAFLIVAAPAVVCAQKIELKLDAVAAKATQKEEIDLEGPMLEAVISQAREKAKEKAGDKAADLFSGVKGVHVRHYEFAQPGAYSDADLASVRAQLKPEAGWSSMVNVKEKNESTQVLAHKDGDQVTGLFVLAEEPRELTVVQIAGSLSLEKLSELVQSSVKFGGVVKGGDRAPSQHP